MIVSAIIAIIASMIVLNLLTARIGANESTTIIGLKLLTTVEGVWRAQNPAGTPMKTYWTYDVSCFNRLYRADGKTRVGFIDIAFAKADVAPAEEGIFGSGVSIAPRPTAGPKAGYWYQAMLTDENGNSYRLIPVGSAQVRAAHVHKFAFMAAPHNYGNTGVRSFIVNEFGVVYGVDTGSDENKWKTTPTFTLQWPSNAPIFTDGPIVGRKWTLAD